MLIFHGYVTLAEANYFMDLTNERSWDSCNQQSPCEDGDPSTTGLGTNTHGFEHDLPIKHGNGKSPFSTYLGFNVVFFSKNQGVSAPPCLALTFIGAMGVQVVLRQRWEALMGICQVTY